MNIEGAVRGLGRPFRQASSPPWGLVTTNRRPGLEPLLKRSAQVNLSEDPPRSPRPLWFVDTGDVVKSPISQTVQSEISNLGILRFTARAFIGVIVAIVSVLPVTRSADAAN